MKIGLIIVSLIPVLYLLDQFCLWLERRGYLYWRHEKPNVSGGVGSALQQFHAILQPTARYTITAQENKIHQNDAANQPIDTDTVTPNTEPNHAEVLQRSQENGQRPQ